MAVGEEVHREWGMNCDEGISCGNEVDIRLTVVDSLRWKGKGRVG